MMENSVSPDMTIFYSILFPTLYLIMSSELCLQQHRDIIVLLMKSVATNIKWTTCILLYFFLQLAVIKSNWNFSENKLNNLVSCFLNYGPFSTPYVNSNIRFSNSEDLSVIHVCQRWGMPSYCLLDQVTAFIGLQSIHTLEEYQPVLKLPYVTIVIPQWRIYLDLTCFTFALRTYMLEAGQLVELRASSWWAWQQAPLVFMAVDFFLLVHSSLLSGTAAWKPTSPCFLMQQRSSMHNWLLLCVEQAQRCQGAQGSFPVAFSP